MKGELCGCPLIAWEGIREQFGVNPCDKWKDRETLSAAFPWVDFSHLERDTDQQWEEHRRESLEEVEKRGKDFMVWLRERQERVVVVVAHSAFLSGLFRGLGQSMYFNHGAMHSIVLGPKKNK